VLDKELEEKELDVKELPVNVFSSSAVVQ